MGSKRRPAAALAPPLEVEIRRLGAEGDGIAETPRGRLYVPLALPGDRVRVRPGEQRGDGRAAAVLEWLARAPGRVTPPCPHFGVCGGCVAQHVGEEAYRSWKTGLVRDALARRGFADPPVEALLPTAPGGRRRAEFAAAWGRGALRLGFRGRRRRDIVDIAVCPVLRPALTGLLPALRAVLATTLPAGAALEVMVTETDTGLDLLLTGKEPGAAARGAWAAFAEAAGLARLCWRPAEGASPEPLALRRAPVATLSGIAVEPPPGAFLQASREAEAALVAAVREAVGPARRIADLYSGCGTFALPLAAAGAKVLAVDSDAGQVAALLAAAGRAGLAGRIAAEARDLDRRPLGADELAGFDAAIFDPPRAGAAPQARELARSLVPVLVAVSCHPPSFARDARTLADGGYRLLRVRPVDQFLWSSAIELVAVFRR